MHLSGLSIDGFGVFHNAELRGLGPGLNVLCGANEAGKSTSLAFVHTILFGFFDRRRKEPRYPPLAGGEPGGRLFLESTARGEMVVERRPGVRGGPVSVRIEGEDHGEDALERILQGVTRHLYRNLYAFSLSELQDLETLTDDKVREIIYGASFGGGTRSFLAARELIDERMAKLYRPRSRTATIQVRLKELGEVRAQLKEAAGELAAYESLRGQVDEARAEIMALKTQLEELQKRAKRCDLHIRLWDDWVAVQRLRERRSELPPLETGFPIDGRERFSDLRSKVQAEEELLREEEQEIELARREIADTTVDQPLVDEAPAISALRSSLEAYENVLRDFDRVEQRMTTADAQAREILQSLGSGWSEDRALAVDCSAPTIAALSEWRERFAQAAAEDARLQDRLEQAAAVLVDRETEVEASRQSLESLGDLPPAVDEAVLEKLRTGRDNFQSVIRDIPKRRAEIEVLKQELDDQLREIDPGWTEKDLAVIDVSVATSQAVRSHEEALVAARTEVEANRLTVANRQQEIDAMKAEIAVLETEREAVGPVPDRAEIREAGDRLRDLRQRLLEDDDRVAESRARRRRLITILALFLGGGGSAVGLVLQHWAGFEFAWILAVLSLVCAAALFGAGRLVLAEDTERVSERRRRQRELERLVSGFDPQVQWKADFSDTGLTDLQRRLEQAEQAVAQVSRIGSDLESIARRKAVVERLAETSRRDSEGAAQSLREAEGDWADFLQSFNLAPETSPRVFGVILARAVKAQQSLRDIAQLEHRIQEMEKTRETYLECASTVAELASVPAEKLVGAVDALYRDWQHRNDLISRMATAETTLSEAERRHRQAVDARLREQERFDAAQEQHRALADDWSEWSKKLGFDESWSVETVRDMLNRIEKLAGACARREEARSELERIDSQISGYRRRVEDVFKAIGRAAPTAEQLPVEVRRLEEECVEAMAARAAVDSLRRDLEKRLARLHRRTSEVERLAAEMAGLFTEAGATDENDFRRRATLFEELRSLDNEIATREDQLRRVAGVSDLQVLERDLATENKVELEVQRDDAERRIADTIQRLEEQLSIAAQAEERCEQLAAVNRVGELRTREESLIEDIARHGESWSQFAVAGFLLDTAKQRFEEKHQPEVVQYATRFFATMTDHRYQRVLVSHDEGGIEVIDQRGQKLAAEVLSRGTQEQLYLAIRFGYICARQRDCEALPIIMDDVLVNFDPMRAAHAAEAIAEMAESHQVLYFTCHPATAALLSSVGAGAEVFDIEDGGFLHR